MLNKEIYVKRLFRVLIILTLVVAGVYLYAPIKTLYDIKEGLESKNAEEIAKHIDFEKLRENIKRRFVENMKQQNIDKNSSKKLAQVATAKQKENLIDGMLQIYLTKDGLQELLDISADRKILDDKEIEYKIEFKDINTLIVTLINKKDNKKVPVILKKYSLFEWKVVDIEVPIE